MTMTLPELIERLQDLHAEITNDLAPAAADVAVVRLAMQPGWPMQHNIADRDLAWTWDEESGDVAVYLADGGQVDSAPFLPENASQALGWS
jgi:hypothetical protein